MGNFFNTDASYGVISKILHWLMAILIIGMLVLGFYMVSLPESGFSKSKIKLIFIHKELGLIILMLAILRFSWRLGNIVPALPNHMSYWQKLAADTMHKLLYAYLFALPLTGWLMSCAGGYPVFFFRIKLPDLISLNYYDYKLFKFGHELLAYSLCGLLGLHITAALIHHFYYKDQTLKRML